MQSSQDAGLVLFVVGVMALMGLVVAFLRQARARRRRQRSEFLKTSDPIFVEALRKSDDQAEELIAHKLQSAAPMVQVSYETRISRASVGELEVGELSMDVGLSILEATRGQERRLSKAKAEDLLAVLRDELGDCSTKDLTPVELVQAILSQAHLFDRNDVGGTAFLNRHGTSCQ